MKPNTARSSTVSIPPLNMEFRPPMSHFESSSGHSISIEEWNSIYSQQIDSSSSLSNSLHDVCQCCGKSNCSNLDYFNQIIRKLESDTRLAAEIGQGLLHKHELYVTESNQQRATLEKQLEEYQERLHLLEQTLEKVENSKSDITKEKNKWFWEYKKRQKILDETVSDLESANDKCNQLSKELESTSSQLEKLRLFKFMARQSESREEALSAKLEDTNQELAICRKNELLLESKIKKLTTKYENLCNSHEIMLQDFQDRMNSALTTQHHKSNSTTIKHVSYSDTNDFIDLIKELSVANTKLKLDLMNCKDQLSESKVQVITLTQKLEDLDNSSSSSPERLLLQDDLKSTLKRTTSVKENNSITTRKKPPAKATTLQYPPPVPTVSASLPTSSFEESPRHYHEKHIPKEAKTTPEMKKSPFILLQEQVAHIIERLRGSDIRALNRRLKRAFDIAELSNMSNSIIDNILMDVDTLESRFLWVESSHDLFFPILDLFKDILKETGILRSTVNELQVEYVKKVEENQARVEEEIIKKRQLMKQQQTITNNNNKPLFAWIGNLLKHNKPADYTVNTTPSIVTGSSSELSSTLTKTTESSHSLVSPDEEEHLYTRKPIESHPIRIHTFPRHMDNSMKRRQIPYFPPMASSLSSGTSRSTPSIPIRNNRNNQSHRIHIDYEGIGPSTIRPIPSDVDWKATNFSSSWLGGK